MELISTELTDILVHWENVKKDEQAFIKDLKGTGGAKLGRACTSLGADPPDTKEKAIKTIIEQIKVIEANGGELPEKVEPLVIIEEAISIPKEMFDAATNLIPEPEPEKKKRGRPTKVMPEVVIEAEEPVNQEEDFKILLDESIEKLVPRSNSQQYETIKHSIKTYGWKSEEHRLICLPDGTLIDGYTRFKILGELGIPILPWMVDIRNIPKDKIKEEVFTINIARRHLPDTVKIEWAQRYMPIFKEKGKPGPKPKTDNVQSDENNSGLTSAPNSGKDSSHSSRKEQASAAGVGTAQLKEYNWCEKWIPELLEKGKANGEATHTIYKKGQKMKKLIQKHGMWKEVKGGERAFDEAYSTAQFLDKTAPPPAPEEPASAPSGAGPLEKEILLAKGWVIEYFEKRYGFKWSEMPELLEDDANLLSKFDARAAKHRTKGE
jgi:hypothetical protein